MHGGTRAADATPAIWVVWHLLHLCHHDVCCVAQVNGRTSVIGWCAIMPTGGDCTSMTYLGQHVERVGMLGGAFYVFNMASMLCAVTLRA